MSTFDFDKSLTAANYELLRKLLKEVSGLHLTDNKMYLVETRLQAVAKEYQVDSLDKLINLLKGPQSQKLRVDIAEAMATPETFFFRDKKPFDAFKELVVPNLLERKAATKRANIWCAACSSGQEPYSLAMLVDELKGTVLKGWDIKILATDFSNKILKKAQDGIYTQFEVQRGLPIQYLMKHFQQQGTTWIVKDTLKSMVQFKNFNLLQKPQMMGSFDVVFCRNVLFYFDAADKRQILSNLAGVMEPHAMMFLGSAESTIGVSEDFKSLENSRGVFVKTTFQSAA